VNQVFPGYFKVISQKVFPILTWFQLLASLNPIKAICHLILTYSLLFLLFCLSTCLQ